MTKRILVVLLTALLVTVSVPILCLAAQHGSADYTASLISDLGEGVLSAGEDLVEVSVLFSGNTSQITAFHTYDVMLSYDAEHLSLITRDKDNDHMDITIESNWIRVKGYGAEKSCEDPAVTLQFKPQKPGLTGIRLIEARVDYSDRAGEEDMQNVPIAEDAGSVTVQTEGVPVETEGDGILGGDKSVAIPGEDFSFTLDQYSLYDYELTVKVDGVDITSKLKIDPKKGIHTIPGSLIDGVVEITAKREPKTFTVKLTGSDVSGEKTATFNEDYVFRLGREKGYRYEIEVSVNGEEYTGYTMENDVYTIPGADITGNIKIKIIRKVSYANKAKVTFIGAGSKDGSGLKLTEKGVEYPFKIKRKKGYTYSVAVYVDGKKTAYEYDYELDTYYIMPENVYGEINIAIGKIATVEVSEYITLDKESLFLVVYNGIVSEGQVPRYEGRSMYWSDRYKAYAWLVAASDSEKKVKKAAEENITVCEGAAAGIIDYSGNVNMTLRTDAADLQLVREMYEGKHSLDFMAMQKLLNADIRSDRKVNIRDVAALIKEAS